MQVDSGSAHEPPQILARGDIKTYDSAGRLRHESIRASNRHLGPLKLVMHEGIGRTSFYRRIDHCREDRSDHLVFCAPLQARFGVVQTGVETESRPGQFVLVSTSKPSLCNVRGLYDSEPLRALYVRIPAALLRERAPNVDDLSNRPIDASGGLGRVLRTLLETAYVEGAQLVPGQAEALGKLLLEAISALAVPAVESFGHSRQGRLDPAQITFRRATAYIEEHLRDPALDSKAVAEHCRVSLRYLQSAFAASAMTIAGFIRERRLRGCRSSLCNSSLRERSIRDIAGDWGFDDPSHFSHLYRSRFGRTPRQERDLLSTTVALIPGDAVDDH